MATEILIIDDNSDIRNILDELIKEKGDEDSEHRVFYVGVTRARKSLHIVESKSESGYKI